MESNRDRSGWGVEKVLASEGLKAAMLARVAWVSSRPDEFICAEWMIESWSRGLADLACLFMVCDRRLPGPAEPGT